MTRLANQRLAGIVQSEIRAMTTACSGVKGINLAQGVCDPGVPEPVIRGAKQAMDQGSIPIPGLTGLSNFEWRWLKSKRHLIR